MVIKQILKFLTILVQKKSVFALWGVRGQGDADGRFLVPLLDLSMVVGGKGVVGADGEIAIK